MSMPSGKLRKPAVDGTNVRDSARQAIANKAADRKIRIAGADDRPARAPVHQLHERLENELSIDGRWSARRSLAVMALVSGGIWLAVFCLAKVLI